MKKYLIVQDFDILVEGDIVSSTRCKDLYKLPKSLHGQGHTAMSSGLTFKRNNYYWVPPICVSEIKQNDPSIE